MPTFTMKVFRGGPTGGQFRDYKVDADDGMVVLDVIHRIRSEIDCDDCRHHASGTAIVASKLVRHATDPDTFASWLDYVDWPHSWR